MFAKLSAFIARLGQSIQFVAFFAHLGVAAILAEHSAWWIGAIVIPLAAGVKEFWFDAREENDPPQTFLDNFEDWLGWTLGAGLGMILHRF